MSTMNISLPDSLKEFVDNQVGALGYGSSSEYMRELIRRDRDRQRLRGLLFEGAASPQSPAVDSGYFDKLRSRVRGAADRGAARHAMLMNWTSLTFVFYQQTESGT